MTKAGNSQIMRTITLLITIFSLSLPAYAQYSGGTGEPNDPYQIASADDLMLLGESPEDYDKHFILTADIDLDPNLPGRKVFDRAVIAADMAEWSLYFQGTAFTGHLDGQGHTITNLTIDSFGDYIGLFGIIGSGGYVCNIHLVGGRIRGQSFSYKLGGQSIGNVAGENQGSIIGCHCDMSTQGDSSVGGLVGHNMHGTVSNSYSTGSVNGRYSVGGLVGHSGYSSISNSYSAGSVSGLGTVGGLVGGSRDSSISNSYSVALVSGSGVVGGLLGSHSNYYSYVSNCFWDKEASGLTRSGLSRGDGGTGLSTVEMQTLTTYLEAGWDFQDEGKNGVCKIWQMPPEGGYPKLRIFSGDVPPSLKGDGTLASPYVLETPQDLGKVWHRPMACYRLEKDINLAGMVWSTAVIPAFAGRFAGQGHKISNMTISGEGYLGLFGSLTSGAVVVDLGLEDVNVVGTHWYVGGLVGSNSGSVSNSYCTGTISGTENVGGLVGLNSFSFGTVSNSYSTASVSGKYAGVGGLAGSNSGFVTNSYSTGSVRGSENVGGLVPKQAYRDFLDEPLRGDFFSAAGCR